MAVKSMVTMAVPDVLFEDGKDIDLPGWSLRTIWTPGHSPGHVCFYSDDRKLLLSGDHVLPRITPNISAHTQQAADPLGDFLASLSKLQGLETDEVLPAHEYRFSDLAGRLDEMIAHHDDRLDEIEGSSPPTRARRPGRSPSNCTGHGRGTRSRPSCSDRPTARPWPTACCSSFAAGSVRRGTQPARYFRSEP